MQSLIDSLDQRITEVTNGVGTDKSKQDGLIVLSGLRLVVAYLAPYMEREARDNAERPAALPQEQLPTPEPVPAKDPGPAV